MSIQILTGHCAKILPALEGQSIHCCVTSPPYYNLRDYQHADQIGNEPTPDAFVAALVGVFREVRRVLRDDGTLWVNLGDSWSGGKQLLGMPWRLAFALQSDGWILRSEIIWAKPNPMPESVTDRPTKAHEQIFLLSKSPRYFYDAEAIREPSSMDSGWAKQAANGIDICANLRTDDFKETAGDVHRGFKNALRDTRNKRSVWEVSTTPFSGAHFATFPPKLIAPCILAGCPERVCAACGAPVVVVVERETNWQERKQAGAGAGNVGVADNYQNNCHGAGMSHDLGGAARVVGRKPSCACGAAFVSGTVLDPFFGAGTTGLVADRLGRNCIGIELNPDYSNLAMNRLRKDAGMFAAVEAL